jgi:hypothetical protein
VDIIVAVGVGVILSALSSPPRRYVFYWSWLTRRAFGVWFVAVNAASGVLAAIAAGTASHLAGGFNTTQVVPRGAVLGVAGHAASRVDVRPHVRTKDPLSAIGASAQWADGAARDAVEDNVEWCFQQSPGPFEPKSLGRLVTQLYNGHVRIDSGLSTKIRKEFSETVPRLVRDLSDPTTGPDAEQALRNLGQDWTLRYQIRRPVFSDSATEERLSLRHLKRRFPPGGNIRV